MRENGAAELRAALTAALYRVFRAVARLCLRRGVTYEAVAEVAKRAFVDVAYREFIIEGRKQSASRVSLLTGIHRKDVGRMLAADVPADSAAASRVASSAGIISGWRRDKEFADSRGTPAALPFDGPSPTFMDVVKRYGRGDVPARAVLDELVRVGAATRQRDGKIRLVATAYVPATTSVESLAILGTDVSDLVAAIDHNLSCPPGQGFLQRKVTYDNLPAEVLEEILGRIEREGTGVLEKLDRVMARHDRDSNPKVEGTGRKRAMVGVYCFAEDIKDDPSEE